MRLTEIKRYEMLKRVSEFGTARTDQFPKTSVGGQAFGVVEEAVAQLSDHAVSKMAAAREGRKTKGMAREALVDGLDAIVRTARVIAEEVPGFGDSFMRPKRRQADQALVTTGRVFVRDAEPVKDRLIAHGMPPKFVEELEQLVDRFEHALDDVAAGKTGQNAAQAGIETVFEAGSAAVRKLDVIVENQLKNDPVATTVWWQERRIGGRRSKTVAITAAPVPVSVPAEGKPAPAVEPEPDPELVGVTS